MVDEDVIAWLASVSNDPYAFAMGAFPWGEQDTRLEESTGLEDWQKEILFAIRDGLVDINTAIQLAVASGHGVGKSALVAIILLWSLSTRADTRGVVTANTETQLKTKTWAELGRWYNDFIAKEYFTLTATALFSKDPAHERTWRIDMVPWSERNTEAFAGLHNKGRRIIVVFDEGSAIPDVIYEVTEGALTDSETQIIWCVFGNPTRNTGRFRECFPGQRFASVWKTKQVDSREVSLTNKDQIKKWINTYGEDSDFVRIRVKGIFPSVGEMEFFNAEEVDAAIAREPTDGQWAALALSVDVARYGKNASVIFIRKGRDAQTFERRRYQGLNTVQLSDKVVEAHSQLNPDGIMVDGGGVGGGVVDNLRARRLHVHEVQFGAKDTVPHAFYGSIGERYANQRSAMYGAARAWIRTGSLPKDPEFRKQLMAIKYVFNKKDEIQLVSKEDMLKLEPDLELDDIDAFVIGFSVALVPNQLAGGTFPRKNLVESEYDPFAASAVYNESMEAPHVF